MKFGQRVVLLVSATMISGAIAAPAFATTEYPEGGIWNYGVDNARVWSDYLNPDVCHGSSVVGAYYVTSGDKGPGVWANATAAKRSSNNQAYYRTC